MATKVGKGTRRYNFKIIRVKISTIAAAKMSLVVSKKFGEEAECHLLFCDL